MISIFDHRVGSKLFFVNVEEIIRLGFCKTSLWVAVSYFSILLVFTLQQHQYPILTSRWYLSDRAPQILDLDSNLEWNLNSSPKISCSATGNPLPSHTSIELRKLDSTVLKVDNTFDFSSPAKITWLIHRLAFMCCCFHIALGLLTVWLLVFILYWLLIPFTWHFYSLLHFLALFYDIVIFVTITTITLLNIIWTLLLW